VSDIQLLKDKLKNNNKLLIIGAAGTGKTYLVSTFVKTLPAHIKVLVLAPTHQALSILKDYFSMSKTLARVEYRTIHSALKLRPKIINGERKFVPSGTPIINNYDYIIVDEASMIKRSEMRELLKTEKKIIFLGDKHQLPPVGEEESIIFKEISNKIELKEVKRQSNGNPIVEISKNPESFLQFLSDKKNKINNYAGIAFCKDKSYAVKMSAQVNNPKDLIFLAYRNETVKRFNNSVKKELNIAEQITLKTPIILKSPFKNLPTGTLIIPKFIEEYKAYEGIVNKKGKLITADIKYYLINGNVKIISEKSEKDFRRILYAAKQRDAKFYYKLLDKYAQWDYSWGITIHKSQGSSFKAAIIDLSDILRSDDQTKKKLAYVALTRARILNIIT